MYTWTLVIDKGKEYFLKYCMKYDIAIGWVLRFLSLSLTFSVLSFRCVSSCFLGTDPRTLDYRFLFPTHSFSHTQYLWRKKPFRPLTLAELSSDLISYYICYTNTHTQKILFCQLEIECCTHTRMNSLLMPLVHEGAFKWISICGYVGMAHIQYPRAHVCVLALPAYVCVCVYVSENDLSLAICTLYVYAPNKLFV